MKVIDNLVGEIPVLGWFTGYLFKPDLPGDEPSGVNPWPGLAKRPPFGAVSLSVDKLGQLDGDDDDRLMLALMMMVLLERERGVNAMVPQS